MQKGCLPLTGLIVCLLISGNAYPQSNSNYLEALEQEADHMNLDAQTEIPVESLEQNGTIQVPSALDGGAITRMSPGLSVEGFEQVLKLNYIGSYLFYKRLNNGRKDEVFQFYQVNPDADLIREEILRLNKN